MRLILMLGQCGETMGVEGLMEGICFGAFLRDKAYDADPLQEMLISRGIKSVIPAPKGHRHPASNDAEKYKWRDLVENYFQKLKEFKRIVGLIKSTKVFLR